MIETLLSMALALLIAAQQPNVPEITKNQAIETALFAISFAQTYKEESAQVTFKGTPKAQTPLLEIIPGSSDDTWEAAVARKEAREAAEKQAHIDTLRERLYRIEIEMLDIQQTRDEEMAKLQRNRDKERVRKEADTKYQALDKEKLRIEAELRYLWQ